MGRGSGRGGEGCDARQRAAAVELVRRVRREVDADLVQVSLFGSRARGEGRPDSDVDLLLIFRRLPPDREPQATHAEALAEEVAAYTGVPVTAWSVSLVDLEHGRRTPMLVDAMRDGVPLWSAGRPLPPVRFTPADAMHCTAALLDRVEEGSDEVRAALAQADPPAAALRARDDLVRMAVALHLLRGVTEPRRGAAAEGALRLLPHPVPDEVHTALRWAAGSYGAGGREEESPPPPPPGGLGPVLRAVELLRRRVRAARDRPELRAPGRIQWGHPICNGTA